MKYEFTDDEKIVKKSDETTKYLYESYDITEM